MVTKMLIKMTEKKFSRFSVQLQGVLIELKVVKQQKHIVTYKLKLISYPFQMT